MEKAITAVVVSLAAFAVSDGIASRRIEKVCRL
jgi:hypothetical protein